MDPTTPQQCLHLHTQSYLNHYINHIIQPDTYSVADESSVAHVFVIFCTSSDSFRGARKRFPDSMCGDPGPPWASQSFPGGPRFCQFAKEQNGAYLVCSAASSDGGGFWHEFLNGDWHGLAHSWSTSTWDRLKLSEPENWIIYSFIH